MSSAIPTNEESLIYRCKLYTTQSKAAGRHFIYGLTISPTYNPTKPIRQDIYERLSGLVSSTYDCVAYFDNFELKPNTKNVLHLHCIIASRREIKFKTVNRLNRGWQFYFERIKTFKDYFNWGRYCIKSGHDDNIILHDYNTHHMFL